MAYRKKTTQEEREEIVKYCIEHNKDCKSENKNVGKVENKNVGKPTKLFSTS